MDVAFLVVYDFIAWMRAFIPVATVNLGRQPKRKFRGKKSG
jgi:hypothetical protein